MTKATVIGIQVGGLDNYHNLENACKGYIEYLENCATYLIPPRTKIQFAIQTPDGGTKYITIRDEDEETVAYGDFEGLPSFLDYSKEVLGETNDQNEGR